MKKFVLFLVFLLISFIGSSQGADITFVHSATAANNIGTGTIINHPLLNNNPSAVFFITHSLAGDGTVSYNPHTSGIHYYTSQNKWIIYNDDATPMLLGSSYNVLIPGTESDTVEVVADGANYYYIIDDPKLNNKPNLNPILTHRHTTYSNLNYGVYYTSVLNKWGIFCEDGTTHIPASEIFFILAKPSETGYNADMSFRFSPTTDNFSNGTLIDHPLLNNHPEAIFMATHKFTGFFDHTLSTYYRSSDSKWVLVSENTPVTFAGEDFSIVVSMPTPANNLCVNAINLTVGGSFGENDIIGDLLGSDGTYFGNVWYKVIVPATGFVTLETAYNAGSLMHDTYLYAYSGNCGSLVYIIADDNSGSGSFSKIALSGQSPGDILYFKVEEDASTSDPSGTFRISAYDPSLGIADAVIDGFSMYPNPVENILNIQTTNPVDLISIYNILGQEVINTSKTQIDMSALPSGSYVVKVQAGNQIGAYNLIKQ
jgi:hypothetical protein